ncbi:MAG: metallophosphoesterase [Patescibacteria group bacterium]|nr:metallophosphoesterase [Patescibacteria group bacterium]
MRLVATSDLHGTLPSDLPEGDVLVVAGDLMPVWNHSLEYQMEWADHEFVPWLRRQPFEHIAFIAGNHDFVCEEYPDTWLLNPPENAHYLCDNAIKIDGVKIYGSPWSGQFGRWAFMAEEDVLSGLYASMPTDIDVLLTHGPPYLSCDREQRGTHTGSPSLRAWIKEHQPPYVITGHIHEAYGYDRIHVHGDHHRSSNGTAVYNVSLMNRAYEAVNKPVVIEL